MTLNGVIVLVLLYFTEFDSFAGLQCITSQWLKTDQVLSAEYRLLLLAKS